MQVLMQESAHQGISVTFELHHNCLGIGTTNAARSGRFSRVLRHPTGGKLHHCTTLQDATGCSTNLPQKGLLFTMNITSNSCRTTPASMYTCLEGKIDSQTLSGSITCTKT
jgi:hypothetical protein